MALHTQLKELETSSPHAENFIHEPLDLSKKTIRTIRILPGHQGSRITCQLQHRTFGRATQNDYVCLSYMWGGEEKAQDINVNGRCLKVRRNLWDFLVTARDMKIREWLWIDAICIDQSNVEERNHQVTQMGEIYQLAKRVLIWPGIFPHKMRGLRMVAKALRRLRFSEEYPDLDLAMVLHPIHLIHQRRMIELDRRGYWIRLWIVQEVVLAQEAFVILNKRLVRWNDIAEWCTWWHVSEKPRPAAHIYALADERKNTREVAARQFKFFGRLGRFYNSQCTDIRDRVFGILGLLGETAPVTVNYNESALVLFINCIWSFGPHGPDDPFQPNGYFMLKHNFDILSRALNVMPLLLCPHKLSQHPTKAPSARNEYFNPSNDSIYLLLTAFELDDDCSSSRGESQAFERAFCSGCRSPAVSLIDTGLYCQMLERPDALNLWMMLSGSRMDEAVLTPELSPYLTLTNHKALRIG